MSTTSVRVVLFGVLAGGLIPAVPAQIDPMILSDATVQAGQTATMVAMLDAQAKHDTAQLRRKGRLPVVTPASAKTRFTPSQARRKAQAAKFMAALKSANPTIAGALAPAFGGDPVRYAAPFLAKYGARTDDVADLAAVYLVSSWYGAHGKTTDPAKSDVAAVRDQLRRAYRSSSKLRGAPDAAKQNVGEGCLYLAMLNDVFVETMKAQPASKARVMAEIASGVKATFGLDLRAMRITKAGLVS